MAWACACWRKSICRGLCTVTMKGCFWLPLMIRYPMAFLHFHQLAECILCNHTPQHKLASSINTLHDTWKHFCIYTQLYFSHQHKTTEIGSDLNEHVRSQNPLKSRVFPIMPHKPVKRLFLTPLVRDKA